MSGWWRRVTGNGQAYPIYLTRSAIIFKLSKYFVHRPKPQRRMCAHHAIERNEHVMHDLDCGVNKAQRLQRTPACLTYGKPGMQSGQHRNALETRCYLDALRALIAFFTWSAATSDHWNSFEWKRFFARIYSPKASFWDWSLRQRFEQSYCE